MQKARLLIADGLPSFKVGRGKQTCSKIRANGAKILAFAKKRAGSNCIKSNRRHIKSVNLGKEDFKKMI